MPSQAGNGSHIGIGVFSIASVILAMFPAGCLALGLLLTASFCTARLSAIAVTCLGFRPYFFRTMGAGVGRAILGSVDSGGMLLAFDFFI